MALKTKPWNVVNHLKTEADRIHFLEACFEENDPVLIAAALCDVARARGMAGLARKTGLTREGLCKALSPDGNPSLATILKVSQTLGLKLRIAASQHRRRRGG
jgi:probable addiction module antidote protein